MISSPSTVATATEQPKLSARQIDAIARWLLSPA